MERLQEGKDEAIRDVIEKFACYFIAEFTHFLRLHGFLKLPRPPVSQPMEQKLIQ